VNEYERMLKEHTDREDTKFEQIADDIDAIKNNHLAHMQIDMAGMRADIAWVKWAVILMLGVFVTGSLALLYR
jgi:hypothetical protein